MHHELETLVLSQRNPTLTPAVDDVRNWPAPALITRRYIRDTVCLERDPYARSVTDRQDANSGQLSTRRALHAPDG
jgi:hypothetical protein